MLYTPPSSPSASTQTSSPITSLHPTHQGHHFQRRARNAAVAMRVLTKPNLHSSEQGSDHPRLTCPEPGARENARGCSGRGSVMGARRASCVRAGSGARQGAGRAAPCPWAVWMPGVDLLQAGWREVKMRLLAGEPRCSRRLDGNIATPTDDYPGCATPDSDRRSRRQSCLRFVRSHEVASGGGR